MVVTLIGFRGTGKTSVAEPLAERLGWDTVDADLMIETTAGMSIQNIFENHGEAAFRLHERAVMKTVLEKSNIVIASGGGAVLDPDTCHEMRAAGPVVWLTASVETIVARIGADETTEKRRPNLTAIGGPVEVKTMLRQREPLYRACADFVVDTDGRDINSIVDEIVTAIGPKLQEGAAE